MKLKHMCSRRHQGMKRQPREWENIVSEELVSKILQFNNKKASNLYLKYYDSNKREHNPI